MWLGLLLMLEMALLLALVFEFVRQLLPIRLRLCDFWWRGGRGRRFYLGRRRLRCGRRRVLHREIDRNSRSVVAIIAFCEELVGIHRHSQEICPASQTAYVKPLAIKLARINIFPPRADSLEIAREFGRSG